MTQPTRRAAVSRQTAETKIYAELSLDGDGIAGIKSGIAFFDHMLSQLVFHGRLDLNLTATGDTAIDAHHTVEDCGIVFGQALAQALATNSVLRVLATLTLLWMKHWRGWWWIYRVARH